MSTPGAVTQRIIIIFLLAPNIAWGRPRLASVTIINRAGGNGSPATRNECTCASYQLALCYGVAVTAQVSET